MDGPLQTAPLPASVCPNCSAFYLSPRCASCGWAEPHDDLCMCVLCMGTPKDAPDPLLIAVDDEDAADGDEVTDTEGPDLGGEGGP